ncbi:PAS domain-containing protein [Castellaniella sp.]|uniref:PAS domain-containing protein n=1 Tax=Castellaniella sp. TaxID=1955812 RepID=UPI002B0038B0|nr:PAS domain-containing protein [Castellaniella sp.]
MKSLKTLSTGSLDFTTMDRRMALAFGLLIFSLMLLVSLSITWYVRTSMEREQNRLATLTTQLLSDAVSKVSFSGQYQVRLLLDKITQEQSDIAYVRLVNTRGRVVADSNMPEQVSTRLSPSQLAKITPLLQGDSPPQIHLLTLPDGKQVREVSLAYRGGFNNEFQGVMQVGISEANQGATARSGLLYLVGLLSVLLAAGMLITLAISRYFGRPVRQLAADLADERRRLGEILDALGAGTWEWDISKNQVRVNQRWADICGYPLAGSNIIAANTILSQCHPDDMQRFSQALEAHLSRQTASYLCEYRIPHQDGHPVWILDIGQTVQSDAQGQPLRVVGARFDISDRHQAEEDFRRENERFHVLGRVSNTGVWEWDAKHGHLWCSPEYFSMLGRDPAAYDQLETENLETVWINLLHPDDREEASRRFAEYLSSDLSGMYESEFRMAHANGNWVWIWSRGSTLRDPQGRATTLTIGTHINVSSLKEIERRLRESQQRLQLISNNIPDSMVFQVDCGPSGEQRQYTYISEGIQHLRGLSVADVKKDPSLLSRQLHPDDLAMIARREQLCLKNLSTFSAEARATLPDGSLRWIHITSSPRRLDNGHLVFDGITTDITQRKLREQEIERLNASLEQRVQERTTALRATLDRLRHTQDELLQNEKLASLGALVAGVSHELNTPIGNAVTVASTLIETHRRFRTQTETGLTRSALASYLDDVDEGSQIIERNLSRAAELISGFKQLAADQTSYQRRPFDLHTVVEEIIMAMQPAVRKTHIQLSNNIPAGLTLDSYPGPLGQVLMNLINNALIHAFQAQESGSIQLGTTPALDQDTINLVVSDNGCGIPFASQKRIFDPFFSTRLGQGGSGLGLHITHTLVTGLLGGRIQVDSTPGQGSRFILQLPLQAPQAEYIAN